MKLFCMSLGFNDHGLNNGSTLVKHIIEYQEIGCNVQTGNCPQQLPQGVSNVSNYLKFEAEIEDTHRQRHQKISFIKEQSRSITSRCLHALVVSTLVSYVSFGRAKSYGDKVSKWLRVRHQYAGWVKNSNYDESDGPYGWLQMYKRNYSTKNKNKSSGYILATYKTSDIKIHLIVSNDPCFKRKIREIDDV